MIFATWLRRVLSAVNPLRFTFRGIMAIAVAGFLVMNAGFFALSHYTTSEREFCMHCHAQQAHSDFTKVSLVHPDLSCPECHAKPTELIPTGYAADADVVSPNCLRCHEKTVGTDEQEGFKHNPLNIKIPHRLHIEEVGAKCTDCHENIAHDKETPATNRPRMERCFNCHVREATDCATCHRTEAPRLTAAYASEADCMGCHTGFQTSSPKLLVVSLFHKKHVAHGISCHRCHGDGQKHGAPVLTREACLSCHHSEAAKRVACETCHEVEAAYFGGTARGEKKGKASPMKEEGVACDDCHAGIAKGHSLDDVKEACAACHSEEPEKLARIEEWQERAKTVLADLSRRLTLVKERTQGATGEDRKTRLEMQGKIEVLVGILSNDKSRGVHNAAYFEDLASEAVTLLGQAEGQ